MSAQKSQIAEEVESLPAESKNKLAAKLIESVDEPSAEEIDALWAEESERRMDAYKKGQMGSIPGDEAFRMIMRRIRK